MWLIEARRPQFKLEQIMEFADSVKWARDALLSESDKTVRAKYRPTIARDWFSNGIDRSSKDLFKMVSLKENADVVAALGEVMLTEGVYRTEYENWEVTSRFENVVTAKRGQPIRESEIAEIIKTYKAASSSFVCTGLDLSSVVKIIDGKMIGIS